MSFLNEAHTLNRRVPALMVSPDVALAMVLRSRPSTPAIEEARRLCFLRRSPASGRGVEIGSGDARNAHHLENGTGPGERRARGALKDATSRGYRPTRAIPFSDGLKVATAQGALRTSSAFARANDVAVADRTQVGTGGLQNEKRTAAAQGRSTGNVGSGASTALAFDLEELIGESDTSNPKQRRGSVTSVPNQGSVRPVAAFTGAISGMLLLFIAFTSVGLHGRLAKSQLVLDQLHGNILIAERSNQRLRVEVAELEAPQRIVDEAKRMGMTPPGDVVFLNPGTDSVALTEAPSVTASTMVPPPSGIGN